MFDLQLQCNDFACLCKRHPLRLVEKPASRGIVRSFSGHCRAKRQRAAVVKTMFQEFMDKKIIYKKAIYQRSINKLSLENSLLLALVLAHFLLVGCSQKLPLELSSNQWQQQLNLPSVQYAAQLNERWTDLIDADELEWFDDSRQRAVPVLYYAPKQRLTSDKMP